VWHDGAGWRQYRCGSDFDTDPVRQARDDCYALREFAEKDQCWMRW
jgi:hypothetical protein